MLILYALTLFVSATLLFLVQPMVGKMLLPMLGGTPAVWNTCMVFFQAILLAGYAHAHASTRWLGARKQAILQLCLLPLPFIVLPISISSNWIPSAEGSPVFAVLAILSISVGIPFFVLSTSAPVLQKWFADTGHPAARDPYFLYGASNLGSMLALLAYPIFVEPTFFLRNPEQFMNSQTHLWMIGYGVLVFLYLCCAIALWRSPGPGPQQTVAATPTADQPLTPERRLRWVVLAFIPSSLLLGGTTYLTTDVAAIPLLWVVPLAIYLLSFIFVFGRMAEWSHRFFVRIMPFAIMIVLLVTLSGWLLWFGLAIFMHLALLFIVSMVCHGEMARDRPATGQLTEFYLLMSLGGVLGGAFNGLLAPILFPTLMEYQLVMVLACLMAPRLGGDTNNQPTPPLKLVGVPLLLLVVSLQMFNRFPLFKSILPEAAVGGLSSAFDSFAEKIDVQAGLLYTLIALGLAFLICCIYLRQPVRFGLCVGAVVIAGLLTTLTQREVELQQRSFFGALKVRRSEMFDHRTDSKQPIRALEHGTTKHGMQWVTDDLERRREPLAYFHRTGPLGQLFEAYRGKSKDWNIAIVGLGTGTIAAYGEAGQKITFYEIDDLIRRIAFDPQHFTYIKDAKDRGVIIGDTLMGDARLKLAEPVAEKYDMIIIDAFSSDAIPIHLITRQAVQVYLSRLKPNGLLVFHISNRYLNLEPVLANLAQDKELGLQHGLTALVQKDGKMKDEKGQEYVAKIGSSWVVMSEAPIKLDDRWQPAKPDPRVGIWTDDFSNLLKVFGQ